MPAKTGAKGAPNPSKVDEQGRTIIPKEVRISLGLENGGHIVFEVEGKRAFIRKVKWTPE
ncbi:MAG: AbrB/MazE/SpoVT family DNA-binding domain-containing protein [Halobacteriales archaeon]|nr:AbrB/MazE/SpoVT family DNA-binding domain-containing protein [Halobacteriales archaeon]